MFNPNNEFEELRFILNSKVRSKVLMILFYHEETLDNLKIALDKPSSTISHSLHHLTLLNLISKNGKVYYLTSRGYIFALIIFKYISNLYFIHKSQDFLKNHSIESIPDNLLKDVYLLSGCEYVSSEGVDVAKPLNEYLKIISSGTELNIVLPVFSQIHIDNIITNIKNENTIKLNLITTSNILKSLKKEGYMRKLSRLSKSYDINIWKYNGDLRVFLSFAKNFTTLSLFFCDGQFDDSVMLIDKSINGVKWSKKLFNYYIKNSLKIL